MRKGLFYIIFPLILRCAASTQITQLEEKLINDYHNAKISPIENTTMLTNDSSRNRTWLFREYEDESLMIYGPVNIREKEFYFDGPDEDMENRNLDAVAIDGKVLEKNSKDFEEAETMFRKLLEDYERLRERMP